MILFLILALGCLIIVTWIRLVYVEVNIIEYILHCLTIMLIFCALAIYGGSPKAIDVYRGKTTLEITYKDSIPMDSVVVFK